MFFLYADLRTSSKWEVNVVISKKDHWMALPMDRVAESGLTITVKHSRIKTTEFQTSMHFCLAVATWRIQPLAH